MTNLFSLPITTITHSLDKHSLNAYHMPSTPSSLDEFVEGPLNVPDAHCARLT